MTTESYCRNNQVLRFTILYSLQNDSTYLNCYSPPSNGETDRTIMPVLKKTLKFRELEWFSQITQLQRETRQNENSDLLHLIQCFSHTAAHSQYNLLHSIIHYSLRNLYKSYSDIYSDNWDLGIQKIQNPPSPQLTQQGLHSISSLQISDCSPFQS